MRIQRVNVISAKIMPKSSGRKGRMNRLFLNVQTSSGTSLDICKLIKSIRYPWNESMAQVQARNEIDDGRLISMKKNLLGIESAQPVYDWDSR